MDFIAVIDHDSGKRVWINGMRVFMFADADMKGKISDKLVKCTAIEFLHGAKMMVRGTAEVFARKIRGLTPSEDLTVS